MLFSPLYARTLRRCGFALSLFAVCGCAVAQPKNEPSKGDEHVQPQPEKIKVEAVAPAPFDKTVWRAGESGQLHLSGPLAGYAGTLTVRDFAGKEVWSGQAPKGASRVALPISQPGLYALKAGEATLHFGVVPAPASQKTRVKDRMLIGLNTHFAQRDAPDEAYALLQTVGVDAVRDEMGWAAIEKEKGVFSFPPRHEEYTAKLKRYGIPLHWSASYGNPLYERAGGRYPSAAAAEPYARHIVEILKKFGDNIIAVEVLNEPNKLPPANDYVPVLRATYKAVRAAGFKQPIVAVGGAGPAGGGMAPQYARTVFEKGGRGFADGFSQHPYMTPFPTDTGYSPANGAANLDVALTRAGEVVKKYDLKGSWITELGWAGIEENQTPTAEQWDDRRSARTMVSEAKQAAFTARTLLIAAQYPHLKGIYLYDFKDDGPLALRREHRFGLVRQDLQPKMGFQAFAVAANFLRDKSFVRALEKPDSLLRGLLFRDTKGELWLVAWTTEVTKADVDAVIARKQDNPKASLPRRHMENENHVRFALNLAAVGYDWQGATLATSREWTATSLPMYLKVGRDADKVNWKTLETISVKVGSLGVVENDDLAAEDMNGAGPVAQP